MQVEQLKAQLKVDEGVRLYPYPDTVGKWTIGVGHNLTDGGIPQEVVETLLDLDVAKVLEDLDKRIPWWRGLTEARQQVLANMCFNLGIGKLMQFVTTLAHVQAGRYGDAADSMLQSRWAKQVGVRAQRLSDLMRKG